MSKKQSYNQFGKGIEEGVTEGLKSGDWTKFNSAVKDSVDAVLDSVGDSISKYGSVPTSGNAKNLSSYRGGYSEGEYTKYRQQKLEEEKRARMAAEQKRREEEQRLAKQKQEILQEKKKQQRAVTSISVPMTRVGNYSSTLCMVGGGIGMGVTALSLIASLPQWIAGGGPLGGTIVGGVFLAGFFALTQKGVIGSKRLKLAERFAVLGSKKGYIEIDNLTKSTGRSKKRIVRDFKKMLNLGFFPQGHLDDDYTNLIFTDKVYEQYLETRRNMRIEARKEVIDTSARDVQDEFEGLSQEEAAELSQMIREGNDYIKRLRELNNMIPGEIITAKLTRLEGLLTEIFARVKEHPEQMPKMHELMEYYLPTMIKLVSAYEEYDKVSEPGKDIVKAKKDIENTLDTINEAFKKLLNNLFKDSVWDVTTDAQVLKTMLAQKGLSQTGDLDDNGGN